MLVLIVGLLLFLGVHSFAILAPAARGRLAAGSPGGFKAVYGLVSLLGFVLICYGVGMSRADPVILYFPPRWLRHVAFLIMLPVFPLLLAAYLPGRIQRAAKHPMLAAVKFWALAHLLANGRLADVLLFGGFLVWAVADRISLKRRPPKLLPHAPAGPFNDVIAVVGGLGLYVLFILWAHVELIGVSPLG
jgi:uncharacterized membrane protein